MKVKELMEILSNAGQDWVINIANGTISGVFFDDKRKVVDMEVGSSEVEDEIEEKYRDIEDDWTDFHEWNLEKRKQCRGFNKGG